MRQERSRSYTLAVVCLGLLAACSPERVGEERAALTFPTAWNPVPQGGSGIGDIKGDGQNNGREIIGTAEFPAVFTATDGTNLFVRMRVDDDPRQGGGLVQFGWGLLMDTDGDLSAYEYSLILDASGNPDQIVYGENTNPGTTGDPSDIADNVVETWAVTFTGPEPGPNVQVTLAETCFGQLAPNDPTCVDTTDEDFYIDFGVPLAVLNSDPDLVGAGVDLNTTVKLVAGSSSSGQSLSLDLAGVDQDVITNPTLGDAASDEIHLDGTPANNDGDSNANEDDLDDDNDGIPDRVENSLAVDPDGDNDGDGVPNWRDATDQGDGSASACADTGDGVCDAPSAVYDGDGDGVPNHLDLDSDNDGIPDLHEAGHGEPDADDNGMVDGSTGANGLADSVETVDDDTATANYPLLDTDDDGIPDYLDLDSDGDGDFDVDEFGSAVDLDTDDDGVVDSVVDADGDGIMASVDAQEDTYGFPGIGGVPGNDPRAADADGDGIPDAYDADDSGGTAGDSEGDGLLDDAECAGPWPCADADADGTPDYMTPTQCSNDTLNSDEGCDDGGASPGDGCNELCRVEDTFACNTNPDGLVGDASCASGVCDTTGGGAGVCEPANTCGNGRLEAGEGCDDGGNDDLDGCSAGCLIETGGDCNTDTNGATGGLGCASGICDASAGAPGTCEPADTCGNGVLEAGEGCDDGSVDDSDGCSANCFVENDGECNANTNGATGDASCASGVCDATGGAPGVCEPADTCGNGLLETGEGCDDGGNADADGCSAGCFVEVGNPCNADSSGATGAAGCASGLCDTTSGAPGVCEAADSCGNSVLDAGEGCDDGANAAGDGCSAGCLVENGSACNDDTAGATGNAGCASGLCDATGGAPGVCEPTGACGNGVLEAGEGCDDGGAADGDGCSAGCLIEDGEACNVDTNGETGDASCASNSCDVSGGAPGVCHPVGADTDGDGVPNSVDLDDDNDGIPDSEEGTGDVDGDGVPNSEDLDTDGDGVPDVVEAGHDGLDADRDGLLDCSSVGTNGLCDDLETSADSGDTDYDSDGAGPDAPVDTDGDGVDDYRDLDSDNDGAADLVEGDADCTDADDNGVCDAGDSDGDGLADSADGADGFGDDDYGAPPDTDSDGAEDYRDPDSDGDGINDVVENGLGELDADGDGELDSDTDVDGDGIMDSVDDSDGDGTPDDADADAPGFGGLADPGVDTDGDDLPDYRDPDSDNDGVGDGTDNCRFDPNSDQLDEDGDDAGQACDTDDNGDGFDDRIGVSGGGCDAGGSGAGLAMGLALLGLLFAGRRRRAVIAPVAGIALLLGAAIPAMAQGVESEYPVERFRLSSDWSGVLDVESGQTLDPLVGEAALWLGFADDPLNLYSTESGERERVGSLVSGRLGGNLSATFGVIDRLHVALSVPLVLSQQQDLGDVMAAAGSLSSFGLGDVRVSPKARLLRQADAGVDAAVMLSFVLPTSTSSDFFGESGPVVQPEVAVSRDFGSGVRGAANLGYRVRSRSEALDLVVDDEIYSHLGAGYRLSARGGPPVEVQLTLALATAASDFAGAFNRNHAEVKLGGTYDATSDIQLFSAAGVGVAEGFGTPDWRLLAGVRYRRSFERPAAPAPVPVVAEAPVDSDGDGIYDDTDRCPKKPETVNEFEDDDGCPDELPDSDGDGMADRVDQCPEEPEDKDGFEDDNGCPDLDNDQDGIADVDDSCRDEPGVAEMKGCPDPDRDGDTVVDRLDNCPDEPGKPEFQGCAKRQLVQLTGTKIEILDVVYFKTNRAVIRAKSFKLLDNVAKVLIAQPTIAQVRVEGHTDDRGSDAHNKKLSQSRAEAVVAYLVKKGVAAERLLAQGFGEEKPIKSNKTKKGRAANRRVEFVIVGDETNIENRRTGPTDDTID